MGEPLDFWLEHLGGWSLEPILRTTTTGVSWSRNPIFHFTPVCLRCLRDIQMQVAHRQKWKSKTKAQRKDLA